MQLIRVTSAPYQKQTLVLEDGSAFTMTLYFRPMQLGWFIEQLIYGDDFTLNGMRVVNSPNMLNQWKNKLPFGLGCFSKGNREPQLQEDFSTEASSLYILTEAEKDEFAELLRVG